MLSSHMQSAESLLTPLPAGALANPRQVRLAATHDGQGHELRHVVRVFTLDVRGRVAHTLTDCGAECEPTAKTSELGVVCKKLDADHTVTVTGAAMGEARWTVYDAAV